MMGTPSVLEAILASTRTELERRKVAMPEARLRSSALSAPEPGRGFRAALTASAQIAIVAEFKRRSPSAGRLREDPDLAATVRAYERGGARAVSVLTEGPNFEGSLQDLQAAREACGLPLLRKDFVVDDYQLYEARLAGADAVLLIAAALRAAELERLATQARALGLDALVEVHDAAELDVALAAGAELIGINNRDLRDFSVDVERTFALLAHVPAGMPVVAESGIAAPEQLARLQDAGVAGALVGEALMRRQDPERALRALSAYPAQAAAPPA